MYPVKKSTTEFFHKKPGGILGERKTVIFLKLEAIHTLSTDYNQLCLIPADSLQRMTLSGTFCAVNFLRQKHTGFHICTVCETFCAEKCLRQNHTGSTFAHFVHKMHFDLRSGLLTRS